jgi:UDP-N-acetylglucosamine--N-acetylmuramyl-(pentapeptide) pyrophosphoryl-undecaprenol N-acetylglucosamine transferase
MLGVARLLRDQGADVRFSSSSEVADFILGEGFACNKLPLADVRYGEDGELAVGGTVARSGMIMARAYQQLRLEVSNLLSYNPDAVLSDSVLSTVLASRMLGKKVITIINQLKIETSPGGSAPHRLLSAGASEGLGTLWGLSEKILLPDLPPPYTISESNLWNTNVENTRYIGFLTSEAEGGPDLALDGFAADSRPKIFWQVSGPPRTRAPLLKKAFEISERLSDRYLFVITGGDPAGRATPTPIPAGWFYGWCTQVQRCFRSCDIIVSRAGHETIAQAISCSKPSLLIPIPRQTEQEGNSKKAVKLGVAMSIDQDDLSIDSFAQAVQKLKGEDFAANVSKISRIANALDAKKEIVSALRAGLS